MGLMFATPAVAQAQFAAITEDTLIQVYPKSVWLRKIIVGGADGQETITVHNPSDTTISLTSYTNSNSDFTITGLSQTESFASLETKTFTIDYAPTSGGATVRTGTLTLDFDNGVPDVVIQIWSSKFDSAITPTNVTAAGDLDTEGATYVLQNDIDVSGTAFVIKEDHISFDLNGYTIKYGSGGSDGTHGIWNVAGWVDATNGGTALGLHVYNGTIEQSGYAADNSGGQECHAIYMERQGGSTDTEFSNLTINVDGHGAKAIQTYEVSTGTWIHDCTMNSKVTTIDSRHSFDGAQVKLHGTTGTRHHRTHDNTLNDSPQTGIYDAGVSGQHYNNTVSQDSLFTNDFAILAHSNSDIFNNTVDNVNGRGIRFVDGATSGMMWGNSITVRGLPNNAEYGGCQLQGIYGIQLEGNIDGARIYNNTVVAIADECQANALRITETFADDDNRIFRNSFEGRRAAGATADAFGVSFASNANSGVVIENNTFIADTAIIDFDWSAGLDMRFKSNSASVGNNPDTTVYFNYFMNGNATEFATGMQHVDWSFTGIDEAVNYDSVITGSRKDYSYTMLWTLTVQVNDGNGDPISGALVVIDDLDALEVFNNTTDANGQITVELEEHDVNNTAGSARVVTARSPHDLTISKAGFTTRTPSITMDAIKTLTVNMATGEAVES